MGDHLKSANEYIKDVRREQELRVRLRKIEALVDGGATEGERRAAQTKAKAIRSRLEKVQAKIQVMDQDEMHRQDYLDRARENYFFTREPEHLAVYLEAGGEIDDQVRAEIIERLRKGKPSKKGSSDPFGDIVVYEAIRKIRMEQTYEIFAIYDELENARQSGDNRTVEELLQGLPPEINLKDARQMYMDNIDEKIATGLGRTLWCAAMVTTARQRS